jgi:hypothetical protein
MAYKAEMQTRDGWYSNQVVLATEAEAKGYGLDLFHRWTTPSDWRVAETAEAVNYRWDGARLVKVEEGAS